MIARFKTFQELTEQLNTSSGFFQKAMLRTLCIAVTTIYPFTATDAEESVMPKTSPKPRL